MFSSILWKKILFLVSFTMQKLLSLIRSHLFIFVFHYFGRWIEKDIASIYMSVLTVFPLRASQLRFPGGTSGKEPTCQCRRQRRWRFNPWVWKNPGEGHVNPLQYSRLKNSTDRGDWWAIICRATKSQTQLKQLNTHALHLGLWSILSLFLCMVLENVLISFFHV